MSPLSPKDPLERLLALDAEGMLARARTKEAVATAALKEAMSDPTPMVQSRFWRNMMLSEEKELRGTLIGMKDEIDDFIVGVVRLKRSNPDIPDAEIHAALAHANESLGPEDKEAARQFEISKLLLAPTAEGEPQHYLFEIVNSK